MHVEVKLAGINLTSNGVSNPSIVLIEVRQYMYFGLISANNTGYNDHLFLLFQLYCTIIYLAY